MNKNHSLNKALWKTFLQNLPGNPRSWSKFCDVGATTMSNWRNASHNPRQEHLRSFLSGLESHLTIPEKENIAALCLNTLDIPENSGAFLRSMTDAREAFASFMKNLLFGELNLNIHHESAEVELLNTILSEKLRLWFSSLNHISFESRIINDRLAFMITLTEQDKAIPPILLTYSHNIQSFQEESESLTIFQRLYTERTLLHIAVTLANVDNMDFYNLLRRQKVYLKRIRPEDFHLTQTSIYVYAKDSILTTEQERNVNVLAEVIYRKFLDCAYLIYKEIICYKYPPSAMNHELFQGNAGLGNYPYAMQRAISFEKHMIERAIRKKLESHGKKLDLILDFNTLGGLCGIRLSRYAERVFCVDSSERTLQTIKEIIYNYNQTISEQQLTKPQFTKSQVSESQITNVHSVLLRDDNYDIVSHHYLVGKADFIILGLGMLSFAKSPQVFLRKVATFLKEDGQIFISCYNSDSLSVQMKKYENLIYKYDSYNKRFVYTGSKNNIPVTVKMYSFSEFKDIIMKYYDISGDFAWSYPIISSLFPVDEYNSGIDILKEIDKANAMQNHYQLPYGNYNMLLASQYPAQYSSNIYKDTKSISLDRKILEREIYHETVVSRNALVQTLAKKHITLHNNFLKSILVKDWSDPDHIQYYMIILPLDVNFSKDPLRQYYTKHNQTFRSSKIALCQEKELRQLGLAFGGVCPFSYSVLKEKLEIKLLYAASLMRNQEEKIYTYSGRNDMTYQLSFKQLRQYLTEEQASPYYITE